MHCVKNVRIRSFFGTYFPALELNTESYGVYLCIQFKCGKIWTRKSPKTDTFLRRGRVTPFNYFTYVFTENSPCFYTLCSLDLDPKRYG